MLYKVRDFVNVGILKAIYHAQKQPTRGVPRKRCSENIQQIYRRTPMPKCGFNNVALRSGCFMCYLSHIFIRRGLYGNRMYTKPVVFSYFKRNHQDWFILKNVISILILSFSNQKWWNSLIKLKFKIFFSSANVLTTNYLPSLIAGLYFPLLPITITSKGHLKIPTDTTTTYGKRTFISMATKAWHNIWSQIKDPMINTFSPNKLKIFLFDFYLNLYQT